MKDLEWLKEKIVNMSHTRLKRVGMEDYTLISKSGVLEYVDQLDEPEVLSQEWIDKNQILVRNKIPFHMEVRYAVPSDVLSRVITPRQYVEEEQVQKYLSEHGIEVVEKPVIPKFVADFIKRYDGDFYSLLYDADNISSYASLVTEEYHELGNWLSVNSDELLQAVANGYEVEEEQKFIVRDQQGVYLLAKNHMEQGNVQTVAEIVEYYGVEEIELGHELTEQEIRDYDERFWPFAVKVEELE